MSCVTSVFRVPCSALTLCYLVLISRPVLSYRKIFPVSPPLLFSNGDIFATVKVDMHLADWLMHDHHILKTGSK